MTTEHDLWTTRKLSLWVIEVKWILKLFPVTIKTLSFVPLFYVIQLTLFCTVFDEFNKLVIVIPFSGINASRFKFWIYLPGSSKYKIYNKLYLLPPSKFTKNFVFTANRSSHNNWVKLKNKRILVKHLICFSSFYFHYKILNLINERTSAS